MHSRAVGAGLKVNVGGEHDMAFETRMLTGRLLAERYRVGELSREREMTTQFEGEDTRTGMAVQIEVVREGLGGDSRASRALAFEVEVACRIRHPNVAIPRDVGALEDGSMFVVTAEGPGEMLDDRVCVNGAMAMGDVVRVGLEVLSALAAAHEKGIVHGDLRPESIFLVERDGLLLQTLVTGFSRARSSFANIAFVAPELTEGAAPNEASDLYAVAAILYLAATGYPPFMAPSGMDLDVASSDGTPQTPSVWRREIPARLVRVLVQAMDADPGRRFASARDMLRALEIVRGAFGAAYPKDRASHIEVEVEVEVEVDVAPETVDDARRMSKSGVVPAAKAVRVCDPPRIVREAQRATEYVEGTRTLHIERRATVIAV